MKLPKVSNNLLMFLKLTGTQFGGRAKLARFIQRYLNILSSVAKLLSPQIVQGKCPLFNICSHCTIKKSISKWNRKFIKSLKSRISKFTSRRKFLASWSKFMLKVELQGQSWQMASAYSDWIRNGVIFLNQVR